MKSRKRRRWRNWRRASDDPTSHDWNGTRPSASPDDLQTPLKRRAPLALAMSPPDTTARTLMITLCRERFYERTNGSSCNFSLAKRQHRSRTPHDPTEVLAGTKDSSFTLSIGLVSWTHAGMLLQS